MSFCSPGQFTCSNINCYRKCLIWLRRESQWGSSYCSWGEGSGAFAANLVMLKGSSYWVNNANNMHQFRLWSVFAHVYMCFLYQIYDTIVDTYKKCIEKLLYIYLDKNTHNRSSIHMFDTLHVSRIKILKKCSHAYSKCTIQTRLKKWSQYLI